MNEQQNEFESLRRLLSLKRHEPPPPGYFRDFAAKVIARIEAHEAVALLPWWQRMGLALRPAAVCAFGVALCMAWVGALFAAHGQGGKASPFLAQASVQRDATDAYDRDIVPVNLAEVPASMAPVLPRTSPFNQFIPSTERAKFNVLLVGSH